MRWPVAAAAAVVVAASAMLCPAVVGAPASAPSSPRWADIRADLEALAGQARERSEEALGGTAPGQAGREPEARTPGEVADVLGRLDRADDAGAAASAWRSLFGAGFAALRTDRSGPPTTVARLANVRDASRFVERRLARARAAIQGRTGAAQGAAALHDRLRRAADTLAASRSRSVEFRPGVPNPCGPVRVVASGDTSALGDLCSDLASYWGGPAAGTSSPLVRIAARRTGSVPQAERDITAAASVVDGAALDVEGLAARRDPTASAPGTSAPAPASAQAPAPDTSAAAVRARRAVVHPAARAPDPLPVAAPEPGDTEGSMPSDPGPVLRPAGESNSDRITPLLAAAGRPRNWMPAAGGLVALICGVVLVRRMRERSWAGGSA